MMGGSDGIIRPGNSDLGGIGDGGGPIGEAGGEVAKSPQLPPGARADGISIAERRAGAIMELANEPQGARRFILAVAIRSGQPISEIERLRINEGLWVAKVVSRG